MIIVDEGTFYGLYGYDCQCQSYPFRNLDVSPRAMFKDLYASLKPNGLKLEPVAGSRKSPKAARRLRNVSTTVNIEVKKLVFISLVNK